MHPSHRQEINGSNVPQQALPSIHASYPNNSTQNSNNQNYYLPRHYLKNLPLVANNNNNNNNNNNGFTVNNSQSMKMVRVHLIFASFKSEYDKTIKN